LKSARKEDRKVDRKEKKGKKERSACSPLYMEALRRVPAAPSPTAALATKERKLMVLKEKKKEERD
jgi:hypothetical protein